MLFFLIMTVVTLIGQDNYPKIDGAVIQTFSSPLDCQVARASLYMGETREDGKTTDYTCIAVQSKEVAR